MTGRALSTSRKWEIYFSVLNHMMIGSVSLFVTWHCYHFGITAYTMHVWLSTIGVSPRYYLFVNSCDSPGNFQYQLLMTEAILALYASNCWSFFHVVRTKRTIHWIMQVIGSIFAIVGTVCVYWGRATHFRTVHSLTGKYSDEKKTR